MCFSSFRHLGVVIVILIVQGENGFMHKIWYVCNSFFGEMSLLVFHYENTKSSILDEIVFFCVYKCKWALIVE